MIKILKAGKELREYKAANVMALCPLCGRKMKYVESRNTTVDHSHKTGMIRGILCRNCNGIEGKIHNLCIRAGVHIPNTKFLTNLVAYWQDAEDNPTGVYYPGTKIVFGRTRPPVTKRRKKR